MLVIKVELHPWGDSTRAREVARMRIYNDGTGTPNVGNYGGDVYRMPYNPELLRPKMTRHGSVARYARKSLHVWNLVARMLKDMGYK